LEDKKLEIDQEMPNSQVVEKVLDTSAGTIGALTAVAANSPFRAPMTASAISIATPSWHVK